MAGDPWSRTEVEAIVAAYFEMLGRELAGESYNKAAYRQALLPRLRGRSEGAVERKHQNVSAALIHLGFPWIRGYKPLFNFQALLGEVVEASLLAQADLAERASAQVDLPVRRAPRITDILETADEAKPILRPLVERAGEDCGWAPRPRANFLEREARNRLLGEAGELFVIQYEQARLASRGKETLAARVEHTAKVRGDHEGFDVLSFDEDGRERLIEVKTTRYPVSTPFFVTEHEVRTSHARQANYQLYRVYDFEYVEGPRFYRLLGDLNASCRLRPQSYVGWPR